jgi:carboxypeptidase D
MDTMNTAKREPEVAAVMQWCRDTSFALSAGLHSGAQVVNYPYDDDDEPSGMETPTPDDPLIRHVASAYASAVPSLRDNQEFPGGITNGTSWYSVGGGMQDWNYRYAGCNDFTIELSNTKAPSADRLAAMWTEHEPGMLAFLDCARLLARTGRMTAATKDAAFEGRVRLNGNPHIVYADPTTGWYARLVLEGPPELILQARGWLQTSSSTPDESVTLSAADINDDGAVNIADLVLAINQHLPAATLQNLINQILGRQ